MAIHDENEGTTTPNNGQGQAQGQSTQGQQSAYQQFQQAAGGATGQQQQYQMMTNVNNVLSRFGKTENTEGRQGELLTALTEAGKKAVANQSLQEGYQLLRFDRDQHRVGVGAILVTCAYRKGNGTVIAVRPLLIENKAVSLKPRIFGAERIEIPTYIQDTLSPDYWERIANFVKAQYGQRDAQVLNAGYLEIPAEFDATAKNEVDITKLLIQSANRCGDALSRLNGEQPFNITAMKAPNEVLSASLDFSGTPRYDMFGQPLRSSITITMKRSVVGNNNADPYYDADTEFNSVSCYANLEYVPPMQQQGMYPGMAAQETQLFTPAIVVTDVRQASWIAANTPELWWWALSNAYRVTTGAAWAAQFLPETGKKDDPSDIGAITIMAPQIGQKTKTKGDTFTPEKFSELMAMFVRPNPAFIIDVNPVGENSAIESILLLAAMGDGELQQQANQSIIRTLNNLTNNQFSKHFDATKHAIVRPYGTDVHRGWYVDAHENRHDLRDLGTLEMLNACNGNVQEFFEWYRTMCDTSTPVELRLRRRLGFERQLLGQQLVVKGKYHRLVLTPELVMGLDKAITAAGVGVNTENVSTVYGTQRFVGNTAINQFAVTQQAAFGGSTVTQSTTAGGYAFNVGLGSGTIY